MNKMIMITNLGITQLNSIDNEPYCRYYYDPYDKSSSYKNNLKLKDGYKEVHLLEECEVYKLKKSWFFHINIYISCTKVLRISLLYKVKKTYPKINTSSQ